MQVIKRSINPLNHFRRTKLETKQITITDIIDTQRWGQCFELAGPMTTDTRLPPVLATTDKGRSKTYPAPTSIHNQII